MEYPTFILGMHRSGTSLLTRILREAGIFTGHHIDTNEESPVIVTINEGLLHLADASWDEPEGLAEKLSQRPFYERAKQHAAQSWAHPTNQSVFWGEDAINSPPAHWAMKDPRMVFTLPLWLEIYPKARLIWITRHGVDVARSLYTRHRAMLEDIERDNPGIALPNSLRIKGEIVEHRMRCNTAEGAFSLWQCYMEQQNKLFQQLKTAPIPMLTLPYEQLLQSPYETITTLCDFMQYPVSETQLNHAVTLPRKDRAFAYRQDIEWHDFAHKHKQALARFGYDA